jgi:hypothetical protein
MHGDIRIFAEGFFVTERKFLTWLLVHMSNVQYITEVNMKDISSHELHKVTIKLDK